MQKSNRFNGIVLALSVVVTCVQSGYAQQGGSIAEQTALASQQLETLYTAWRQQRSGEPISASGLSGYLLLSKQNTPDYATQQYNAFQKSIYMPMHILPSGAWIMSVSDQSGQIVVTIDVNGKEAPAIVGQDQKQFNLNSSGQVSSITP